MKTVSPKGPGRAAQLKGNTCPQCFQVYEVLPAHEFGSFIFVSQPSSRPGLSPLPSSPSPSPDKWLSGPWTGPPPCHSWELEEHRPKPSVQLRCLLPRGTCMRGAEARLEASPWTELVRTAQREETRGQLVWNTGHSQLILGKAWVLDASRRLWTKLYLAQALKILSLHRHKHCNSLELPHLPVRSDSVCRHVRWGGDQDGCWEGVRLPSLADLSGSTPQNLPLLAVLKEGDPQSECFPVPTPSSLTTSFLSFPSQPLCHLLWKASRPPPHPTPGKVRCPHPVPWSSHRHTHRIYFLFIFPASTLH